MKGEKESVNGGGAEDSSEQHIPLRQLVLARTEKSVVLCREWLLDIMEGCLDHYPNEKPYCWTVPAGCDAASLERIGQCLVEEEEMHLTLIYDVHPVSIKAPDTRHLPSHRHVPYRMQFSAYDRIRLPPEQGTIRQLRDKEVAQQKENLATPITKDAWAHVKEMLVYVPGSLTDPCPSQPIPKEYPLLPVPFATCKGCSARLAMAWSPEHKHYAGCYVCMQELMFGNIRSMICPMCSKPLTKVVTQ